MDQRAKSLIIWQNHSLVVGTPMCQSCCDFLPTLQTVMEFFEPKTYTTVSGGKSKQRHLCMVEPVNPHTQNLSFNHYQKLDYIKLSCPPPQKLSCMSKTYLQTHLKHKRLLLVKRMANKVQQGKKRSRDQRTRRLTGFRYRLCS